MSRCDCKRTMQMGHSAGWAAEAITTRSHARCSRSNFWSSLSLLYARMRSLLALSLLPQLSALRFTPLPYVSPCPPLREEEGVVLPEPDLQRKEQETVRFGCGLLRNGAA